MSQVKVLKLLAVSLLFLALLTPLAQAQEDQYTYVLERSFKLYTPASFTISYEYSNDISGNVIPERTGIGTITQTQLKAIFETNDADTYNVTITIRYSMPIQQAIPFILYSADEIVDSFPLPVYAQTLIFRLTILTRPKPEYPTAEEIVEAREPKLEQIITTVASHDEWLGALTFLVLVNLAITGLDLWLRLRRPIG